MTTPPREPSSAPVQDEAPDDPDAEIGVEAAAYEALREDNDLP